MFTTKALAVTTILLIPVAASCALDTTSSHQHKTYSLLWSSSSSNEYITGILTQNAQLTYLRSIALRDRKASAKLDAVASRFKITAARLGSLDSTFLPLFLILATSVANSMY
jgi:hypothetical protein